MLVGIVRMILWTSKGRIENWMKQRNGFLVEIVALAAWTSKVVKMKKHLPFCREFGILCIEDKIAVDHVD